VKEEQIKMEPMDRLSEVFNPDKTKNEEVIKFVSLELKINRHIEKINTVVTDLNGTDIFLEYDWLVKHNPEVNLGKRTIQFVRCLREYRIQYQNIIFISKTRRLQLMKDIDKEHQEIGKKSDLTNLAEYIQPFTYLFNKKKFKKLLKQRK